VILNWSEAHGHQSGQRVVIGVLSGLFVTTLGQLIMNWYYTHISLAGPADRLDTFYLSLGLGVVPVEGILNSTMQGTSLIMADALLVNITPSILHAMKPPY